MPSQGFIILRHVNSNKTNLYWQECYDCIRVHYPENKIVIIDDNSNYNYITSKILTNTELIQSEFIGRGELLPFYYYIKHKFFDTAVIIHDSVFMNKNIDINIDKYKILWCFTHDWDQLEDETKMINSLSNNNELLNFHKNKNLWHGCLGGMCIITSDFLQLINNKYNISNLLNYVLTRYNRISFERVLGCIFNFEHRNVSYFGDIHYYCKYGYTYNDYKDYKYILHKMPLIKVWTGR